MCAALQLLCARANCSLLALRSNSQELQTVKNEINALQRQADGGNGSASNIKSTASGIEQQVQALKVRLEVSSVERC